MTKEKTRETFIVKFIWDNEYKNGYELYGVENKENQIELVKLINQSWSSYYDGVNDSKNYDSPVEYVEDKINKSGINYFRVNVMKIDPEQE